MMGVNNGRMSISYIALIKARSYAYYFFLFRNLVKPSEMPRPLAITGITAHPHTHTKTLYIK